MKKYSNLGDLLIDYRRLNTVSQHDFAAKLDVDVRTVQRWEKNITLVKIEKEADLVDITFLPHQLIRNLNTPVPIPTFYDFSIRKYSLSELTNKLPDVNAIKEGLDLATDQIRKIDIQNDLPLVNRYIQNQYIPKNVIPQNVLEQAIMLLPELNILLVDLTASYAGHHIALPISQQAYNKLRARTLFNSELQLSDLVDYRSQETPIFYSYSITADSNNGVHYIIAAALKFFRNLNLKDYQYCSTTNRHDSLIVNSALGLKTVWEEEQGSYQNQKFNPIRFLEGNLNEFLFDK